MSQQQFCGPWIQVGPEAWLGSHSHAFKEGTTRKNKYINTMKVDLDPMASSASSVRTQLIMNLKGQRKGLEMTRKREKLTSVSRLPGYQTCEDSCEWRSCYRNEDTSERNSVLHGRQFVSENAPFRTRQMSIWQQRILHQTHGALGSVHAGNKMTKKTMFSLNV